MFTPSFRLLILDQYPRPEANISATGVPYNVEKKFFFEITIIIINYFNRADSARSIGPSSKRPDLHCHSPSAVQHPELGSDSGDQRWCCHGGRYTSGTAPYERSVC